jgi:hypothetical protein
MSFLHYSVPGEPPIGLNFVGKGSSLDLEQAHRRPNRHRFFTIDSLELPKDPIEALCADRMTHRDRMILEGECRAIVIPYVVACSMPKGSSRFCCCVLSSGATGK